MMILTRLVRLEREMAKRKRRVPEPRERKAAGNQWQLQDAKARFSEVFRLAREQGPQRVTKHGRTAVVVLPAEEYERLSKTKPRKGSLVQFFATSPLAGSGIQLDRQDDYGRTVDL
jgi:antitoxin Phd